MKQLFFRLQFFTAIVLSVLMLSCTQQTKTNQQAVTSLSKEIKEISPGILEGYLSKEEIGLFIFKRKHIKSFTGLLWERPKWFSPKLQIKAIKPIIKNYKELTAHYNSNPNLFREDIEYTIQILIKDNSDYFFEKLISLDDSNFKEITQKHYIYPILKYLNRKIDNNSSWYDYEKYINTNDTENELYVKFFEKLVNIVWIDDLNKYRNNSYYDFIFDYNEDYIKDIDIERIFDGTSKINREPSLENDVNYVITESLTDKLIQSKDWLSKCMKMKDLWILEKIIISPKVSEEIFINFSEKDIINYLILLEKNW